MARLKPLVAMLALTWAGPAHAVSMLDQVSEPAEINFGNAVASSQTLAQTFTVGVSGLLSALDLSLVNLNGTATSDFELSIFTVAGGLPDSGLYSETLSPTSLPAGDGLSIMFSSFDVSSGGLSVSAGDELAIVLSRPSGGILTSDWVLWSGGSADSYAGGARLVDTGSSWSNSGGDYAFRTYVDVAAVPEPTTVVLMGLGLVGLGYAGRRKLMS